MRRARRCAKGIGLACAQAFAAAGAKVELVARSRADLDAALAAMPAARHAPVATVADLAGAADAARMVEEAVAAPGEIDVLVNSAGAARRTAPDDLNASNWFPNACSTRAPSPVRAGTVRCS